MEATISYFTAVAQKIRQRKLAICRSFSPLGEESLEKIIDRMSRTVDREGFKNGIEQIASYIAVQYAVTDEDGTAFIDDGIKELIHHLDTWSEIGKKSD